MTQVTVRAAVPLTWLERGQTVTVERSPLIDGALKSGVLELLAEVVPEKVAPPPRPRKGRRG
jgi:hypothetical protein